MGAENVRNMRESRDTRDKLTIVLEKLDKSLAALRLEIQEVRRAIDDRDS